jgi:hypothetical protein
MVRGIKIRLSTDQILKVKRRESFKRWSISHWTKCARDAMISSSGKLITRNIKPLNQLENAINAENLMSSKLIESCAMAVL